LDWEFLLTFVPDMRYASLMRNAGLLMALSAALFVGCKKEKEQNGPSLTVASEPGVVTGDLLSLEPGVDTTLRFKLIAQKGSGKDDADLKDYSFTVTIGGANNPSTPIDLLPMANLSRLIPRGKVTGANGEIRRYTFTVTDKNGKSASRTFTITFRSTQAAPRDSRYPLQSELHQSIRQ
jgi:hypothetical protein